MTLPEAPIYNAVLKNCYFVKRHSKRHKSSRSRCFANFKSQGRRRMNASKKSKQYLRENQDLWSALTENVIEIGLLDSLCMSADYVERIHRVPTILYTPGGVGFGGLHLGIGTYYLIY